MHDLEIAFLDDSDILYSILKDGYFKCHELRYVANLYVYKSASRFLYDLNNKPINLDYVVLDYHMPSTHGSDMQTLIKHKFPKCIIWLYTGMPKKYISDKEIETFNRYISKEEGVSYLMNQLLEHVVNYHPKANETIKKLKEACKPPNQQN